MGRKRIHQTEAERRQAQSERRKLARTVVSVEKRIPLSFTGVDGEGTGKGKNHGYVLLGIGKEQIADSHGLQLNDIFSFLWARYKAEAASVYAGYYLGYDFTQWLRQLPAKSAWMLFTDKGRRLRARTKSGGNPVPFPVRWEGWEFDILGMKRFKLRPEGEKTWLYVCDSGPFFQTSFLKAIDPSKWSDPIVTPEEYETIKRGKGARSSAVLGPDMEHYNVLENQVLARLLVRLDQGFSEMGIRLARDQWFGPGQGAQEWLKSQQNVPSAKDLGKITVAWKSTHAIFSGDSNNGSKTMNPQQYINPGMKTILDTGRLAYYGGWFEIFAHGHISGRTWEYDINSAYPHIASQLPCLQHGRWAYRRGSEAAPLRGRNIRIVHAFVKGTDRHIGAMLHRHPDGKITRPHQTGGYYWQHELDAAVGAGLVDEILVKESWTYEPCDCDPPLAGLANLYAIRLDMGKNTPQGKGARLIYNSVYGKFAQSVGTPRYGNPLYASLITAGCRSMILNAIQEGRTDKCVMVATDAVFFTKPVPALHISAKLGEWSVKEHDNLTLFKPGIYWDDTARQQIKNRDSISFKSRGINAEQFSQSIKSIDNHFSRWQREYPGERDPDGPRDGWFPKITFTSGFSMVTCQQALQWGKWYLAGSVGEKELIQDADPIAKRHSGWHDPDSGIYWSTPYECWPERESTPYDKTFGLGDIPQAEDYGIHPDGWVLDLWKEGMNLHA